MLIMLTRNVQLNKSKGFLTLDDLEASNFLRYDTIRYDTVYLTCSNKLTGSQLSPPHGTQKIKM